MTYILGCACRDGVVLISDKKITSEGSGDVIYQEKLFMDTSYMVIGSSGVSGLFEKFRGGITDYVISQGPGLTIRGLINEVEKTTRQLNETYASILHGQVFDVLMGMKTTTGAFLQYVLPNGFAEPVRKYRAIGSGEPYGSILMKKIWKSTMTMEEAAELGMTIIRYIEFNELDMGVGLSSEDPQIAFIPNAQPPANPTAEQVAEVSPHFASQEFLDRIRTATLWHVTNIIEGIEPAYLKPPPAIGEAV